jgi:TRAP-type C4-dicarboxylate transport system permease small subunit
MQQNLVKTPTSGFDKVVNAFRLVENVLLVICAGVMMLLMFLCTADVIGRYAFNHPITGAYEISTIMMAAIVLLGWAYTQRNGDHVSVEMFYDKFPPGMKKITSLVTLILSLALFVTITLKSWTIAVSNTVDGRNFQILDIPSGPTYFLVPVGGFFISLEIILGIVKLFKKGLKV